MLIAVLVPVASRQKQPRHPLTDEWANTMCSVHILEYYSTLKRKDILSPATT